MPPDPPVVERVLRTRIFNGAFTVSTVRYGHDISEGVGRALYYETAWARGDSSGWRMYRRYPTLDTATRGHYDLVRKLRKGVIPPD